MFKRTTLYFRETVFSGWDWLRAIRLVAGLVLLTHVIQRPDVLTGLVAGVLLLQAATNTGCGLRGSCALPENGKPNKAEDLTEQTQSKNI